jgi:hypothetical protein
MRFWLALSLLWAIQANCHGQEKLSFNEHIRPILSDKCFHCHGPDEKHIKGKLQLHSFEPATKNLGKKSVRQAIVPGNPAKSTLWERITTDDEDDIMPPPETHKTLSEAEKVLIKKWLEQGAVYEMHWAFVPPKLNKAKASIDELIHQSHEKKSLSFNLPAGKRELIRRVSFDLTGLPPTIEEVEHFLSDKSSKAYESMVDDLLARLSYGEHMARYWLDVARYGDTHGLHGDNYREMFLYRDWVIKAFNKNMPFDQFTIEQVAGDMLENPTNDQLIASGFNRLHISSSAGSALKEELYINNVKDRVDAIGTVFLGLTLGCAACHDHKFDPISQKEYYQLFAFFNNLDGPPDNSGVKSPLPKLSFPTEVQKRKMRELPKAKNKKALKKLQAEVLSTLIMKERREERPAYILNRGEYDNPGERVYRKTPSFLLAMSKDLPLNRLGFAKWLVDSKHPLTARVIVNRFWQQLFGIGLVKTSEDFGSQGKWPSQPELLDFLASRFVESNWNVKTLMKMMVMSRTYRQSSKISLENYQRDPENTDFSRGPRFRMDAEMLRDQALAVSGLLSSKMYGRSVKPPQPTGLWQSVALKASNTKTYVADRGEDSYRRSLYTFWKRALPHPAMTIFNAPTRENCTARRERTNTPLQALVLMNETQFFKSSIKLAELTLKSCSTSKSRLIYLYEKMLGAKPDEQESILIMRFLREIEDSFMESRVTLAGQEYSREVAVWSLLANSFMSLDKFKCKE